MIIIQAKSRGLSLSKPRKCSAVETVKAEIMAETSLQALIRHQNHRSNNTSPVPAPMPSSNFQALPMDSR